MICPPIEIGGYKYFVPNGTVRNIKYLDEIDVATTIGTKVYVEIHRKITTEF